MEKFQQIILRIQSFLGLAISPRWATEIIPDEAYLFRRVHFNQVSKSKPAPSAFEHHELSCDWNKHSSPEQSRCLIKKEFKHNSKEFKDPNDFFICSLLVSAIRNLNIEQDIKHNPKQYFPTITGNPNNQAHSLIIGNKSDNRTQEKLKLKIQSILARNSEWVIFDKKSCEDLKNEFKQKVLNINV